MLFSQEDIKLEDSDRKQKRINRHKGNPEDPIFTIEQIDDVIVIRELKDIEE